MGHPISPAKMMSYSWMLDDILLKIETGNLDPFTEEMISDAMLCCQCGICEQYACIFGLSPNKVFAMVKDAVMKAGLKFDFSKRGIDDSMFEHRKVSAKKYALKLGLGKYLVHTEYVPAGSFIPDTVNVPIRQHIGAPCTAAVNEGDSVNAGDVIGEVPSGALGARVHASIDGRVTAVSDKRIVIGRPA
jgi:Na+-translocating ferredoxin:NAD+ oxidoreductase RnfC subunit